TLFPYTTLFRSDVETALGEISGIFGNPNRQVGRRCRGAVKNASQFRGIRSRVAEDQRASEREQKSKRSASHGRARALSNGRLSRNISGRPMNSFATGRRLARSLKTFSMPLSGT